MNEFAMEYTLLKKVVEDANVPLHLKQLQSNVLEKLNYLITNPSDEEAPIKYFAAKFRFYEFLEALSLSYNNSKVMSHHSKIVSEYHNKMQNIFGSFHNDMNNKAMKVVCLNCMIVNTEGNKCCAKCNKVSYCSKECQIKDWCFHKLTCSSKSK